MEENEKKDILDALFFNGKAFREFTILDGKITVEISNIITGDQLELEESMGELKGSTAFVLHTYSMNLLSKTLKKYGDKSFSSSEQAKDFLLSLPGSVVDFLVKKQTEFEKDIAKLYTGEDVDKNFFTTASPDQGLRQDTKQA